MISRRRKLGFVLAVLASAWALIAAASAGATTITVGSVLPTGSAPEEFKEQRTFFNTALPESGANLTSPVNGAIVRWRMLGASGGPFTLRVLRPNGSGAFQAVGSSSPATPAGEGLQTFSAAIPVKAGDLIGVDPTNPTDKIGVATVAGASYASLFPVPLEGAVVAPQPANSGKEIELAAEVQPAPAVKSLSVGFGPLTGGTKVRISGSDLNGASAVSFGNTPAASFTVNGESEIVAIAPAFSKRGAVDITVKTLAGKSLAGRGSEFAYTGCIVPKLRGKTLKLAKQALRNNGCRLGKVTLQTGATTATGKVLSQNPAKGKILANKAKVTVTLKAAPEPKKAGEAAGK